MPVRRSVWKLRNGEQTEDASENHSYKKRSVKKLGHFYTPNWKDTASAAMNADRCRVQQAVMPRPLQRARPISSRLRS